MIRCVYPRIYVMWFKAIFRRKRLATSVPTPRAPQRNDEPLFNEHFLLHLERLSLQAQRTLRGNPTGGEHPSRHQLPGSIFSDHRPYTSGDDLRYVDWNAYARQDHVLVKLGEAEQRVNVHILLDCSKSMVWGQPQRMRVALRLAGALGYLALAHNDWLTVTPFGATALAPFGPTQGKRRIVELLRYLEAIKPQPQTALADVLRPYALTHERGGLLIICSDLLDAAGLNTGLQLLHAPRWQVLVVHLVDQLELSPTLQGPLELEDSETGERVQMRLDAEQLACYKQSMQEWMEQLQRTCTLRGATYTRILTQWSLERTIMPYLRIRRLLD